ncbi:MAG: hypothetical protein WBY94_22570 [Polyangiaceae bacterium]
MREKTRHHVALALSVNYVQIPVVPLLDALAEPAGVHRKEEHDDEGERDDFPTESAQPPQAVSAPTGVSAPLAAFLAGEDPPQRARVNPRAIDPEWALAPMASKV